MPIFDIKNATVTIRDGTAVTPNELEIKLGDGSISWTETKNREYKRDRGRLDTVRDGDEEPVEVKFDFNWEFLKGDGNTTIEDALKQRGDASDWESTDDDECAPYAVDIVIEYTPICSGTKLEIIELLDFRYEKLDHDADNSMISCSGKCNVTEPNVSREEQA